jgi:hypothetical protein
MVSVTSTKIWLLPKYLLTRSNSIIAGCRPSMPSRPRL